MFLEPTYLPRPSYSFMIWNICWTLQSVYRSPNCIQFNTIQKMFNIALLLVLKGLVLACFLCYNLIPFFRAYRRKARLIDKLPGPPGYSLIGSALDFANLTQAGKSSTLFCTNWTRAHCYVHTYTYIFLYLKSLNDYRMARLFWRSA